MISGLALSKPSRSLIWVAQSYHMKVNTYFKGASNLGITFTY